MITPKEAKTISIVDFMRTRGFEPARIHGQQIFYFSPFREEKIPSFNVRQGGGNDGDDVWHDFGEGGISGGDIIELVKALDNTDFRGALEILGRHIRGGGAVTVENIAPKTAYTLFPQSKSNTIALKAVRPLNHFVLLKYLQEDRCISPAVAKLYLKLIWYDNDGRKGLFAFGWRNQSGDYELRSAGKQPFKAVTGRKDITLFLSSYPSVTRCFVFEGILDFLSILEIKGVTEIDGDVVILNSTSLKNRLLDFLSQRSYETVFTFFDNDKAGRAALEDVKKKTAHLDIRQQTFYEGFTDVNEYLQSKHKK